MRALASTELLAVWEWGEDRHTIDRSLALLAVALPERSWGELAALPVGRRNGLLLELRRQSFGPVLAAHLSCSACGEPLEFELELKDLLECAGENESTEVEVSAKGWKVRSRLPDSRDLAAIVGCSDDREGRELLVKRCVLEARHKGRDRTNQALPPLVLEALSTQVEAADPLAIIELQLTCPGCGHRDTELLDAGALIWSDVRTEADRLLSEIDVLARRYGWTEEQILALGPRRRRAYIELET